LRKENNHVFVEVEPRRGFGFNGPLEPMEDVVS